MSPCLALITSKEWSQDGFKNVQIELVLDPDHYQQLASASTFWSFSLDLVWTPESGVGHIGAQKVQFLQPVLTKTGHFWMGSKKLKKSGPAGRHFRISLHEHFSEFFRDLCDVL